jgi:outer membrane protein TolC
VQTALRGFLRSREQAEDLARSVKAAVAATKTEEKLFYDLKADVNRLYTLENTQLLEQDSLAVAQGNIAFNLVNVYRYLGGGWEIRIQNDNGGAGPMTCLPLPAEGPAAPGSEPLPAPKPPEEK